MGSSGSNQTPVASWTTLRRSGYDSLTPARHAPRELKTRTVSPPTTPRSAAYVGFMVMGSRSPIIDARRNAPLSNWVCNRSFGCLKIRCSENFVANCKPSHSAGCSQTGHPGQSGYPNPSIVAESISIFRSASICDLGLHLSSGRRSLRRGRLEVLSGSPAKLVRTREVRAPVRIALLASRPTSVGPMHRQCVLPGIPPQIPDCPPKPRTPRSLCISFWRVNGPVHCSSQSHSVGYS